MPGTNGAGDTLITLPQFLLLALIITVIVLVIAAIRHG